MTLLLDLLASLGAPGGLRKRDEGERPAGRVRDAALNPPSQVCFSLVPIPQHSLLMHCALCAVIPLPLCAGLHGLPQRPGCRAGKRQPPTRAGSERHRNCWYAHASAVAWHDLHTASPASQAALSHCCSSAAATTVRFQCPRLLSCF